jgi:hypothetical protein
MNIRLFIHDVSFDDEAMRAMGEAYDQACVALGNFGIAVTVREIIAKRIIEVAKTGERDPSSLYRQALKTLDIDETLANQLVRRPGSSPPPAYDSITRSV